MQLQSNKHTTAHVARLFFITPPALHNDTVNKHAQRRRGRYCPIPAALAWLGLSVVLAAVAVTVTGSGWLRALSQVCGWVLLAGVAGHVLGRLHRWVMVALMAAGTQLLVVLWLDLRAYQVANQGVQVLWEIYQQEGLPMVQEALKESGVGPMVVALMLFLPLVLGGFVGLAWRRPAAWWPRWTVPLDHRPPVVGLLVGIAAIVLAPGALRLPEVLATFYGPERMTARFVAAGTPTPLPLPGPLPGPSPQRPADRLPANAPRTVVLVIIESLRHDVVTPAIMPRLHAAARTATKLPNARAAANATHPSWYSLMFARHSLWWHRLSHAAEEHTALPPPLRAFADAGYRIHVRSGAGFNYYRLSDAVFGLDRRRADSFLDATGCYQRGARSRPESDRCAIDSFVQLAKSPKTRAERNLFIVLLDSAHFPYAWDTEPPRFAPVAEPNALRTSAYKDIAHVRNRFHSALFSVDRQLGRVLDAIKPLQAGGVVMAVTGDHGEELNEHGKLAHDSELCDVQTRVPLLLWGAGKLAPIGGRGMGAHVDVLPTLLWAVGLKNAARSEVDGVPLQLQVRPWSLVVHTSAGSPFLVAIQTVDRTLELAMGDRRDVAQTRELFLLQTYPTGPPRGSSVSANASDRAALVGHFGAGLRAVFGLTGDDLARPSATHTSAVKERHGCRWLSAEPAVWPPSAATPGVIEVVVRNTGNSSWLHDVGVSYHWLDDAGQRIPAHFDNKRAPLPSAVHPGATVTVSLPVRSAPCQRCAAVELDVVREGVTWLSKAGSKGPVIPLKRGRSGAPAR